MCEIGLRNYIIFIEIATFATFKSKKYRGINSACFAQLPKIN
jgi:hypothetical protein